MSHLTLFSLSITEGLELFRIFLQTEFSEENIEFWISCERFRDVTGSGKQIEEAHRIYTDFVAVQAPHEVNSYITPLVYFNFYIIE